MRTSVRHPDTLVRVGCRGSCALRSSSSVSERIASLDLQFRAVADRTAEPACRPAVASSRSNACQSPSQSRRRADCDVDNVTAATRSTVRLNWRALVTKSRTTRKPGPGVGFGSWLCENSSRGRSDARLIQADHQSRKNDSRKPQVRFLLLRADDHLRCFHTARVKTRPPRQRPHVCFHQVRTWRRVGSGQRCAISGPWPNHSITSSVRANSDRQVQGQQRGGR
jgi:hypothetical protein